MSLLQPCTGATAAERPHPEPQTCHIPGGLAPGLCIANHQTACSSTNLLILSSSSAFTSSGTVAARAATHPRTDTGATGGRTGAEGDGAWASHLAHEA